MFRSVVVLLLLAVFITAVAGMPANRLIMLRVIDVHSCVPVTNENAARVSIAVSHHDTPESILQAESHVAGLIPGFMIDATLLSHRTLSFSNFEKSETPNFDSGWQTGGDRVSYFYPSEDEGSCRQFETHRRMTVILDQKASCDSYPPEGLCVYDAPIEIASEAIAKRYGQ